MEKAKQAKDLYEKYPLPLFPRRRKYRRFWTSDTI